VKSGYREEVRCFSESNEAAGRGHEGTTPMYLTYQSCEYREPEFFALARFEVVMAILMCVVEPCVVEEEQLGHDSWRLQ